MIPNITALQMSALLPFKQTFLQNRNPFLFAYFVNLDKKSFRMVLQKDKIYRDKNYQLSIGEEICQPRWLSWMHIQLVIRRVAVQPLLGRQHSFVEIYSHSLPSADSRRAVVNVWLKNVHNTG